MAKNIRRMLAMAMVLCMFLSALPMQALAAEEDTITATETITGGTIEIEFTPTSDTSSNVSVSGTNESGGTVAMSGKSETSNVSTSNADGSTTEKSTTTVELAGTETSGDITKEVQYEETTTDTTITASDGTVTASSTVVDGSETKDWTEKAPETGLPEVEVKVEAKPGSTGENSVSSEPEVETEGSKESGNYTETTTTIVRDVTVKVEQATTQITESITDLTSVSPESYDGKKSVDGNGKISDKDLSGVDGYNSAGGYLPGTYNDKNKPDEEGYDYQLTGWGEIADPGKITIETQQITYSEDENGNLIPVEGEIENEQATQFVLQNADEEKFYAYCIDKDTDVETGSWYTVSNLEDSDYYASEDAEEHLRAIVMNGYWGTAEGTGSINQIRESVAKNLGETITVDGEEYNVEQLMAGLTEGEAMTITQAAIWSYSNGSLNIQDNKNGLIVTDPANTRKGSESKARMMVMYNWLTSLTQEKTEETTTVVNEQNFVKDISLTVGDKVREITESGSDSSEPPKTNGVYKTDLNFSLAFVPTANDDLLVCLKYTDLDGNEQTVTKRLAGNAAEGETYGKLKPNDDGSYTFEGLQLSENKTFDFDLNLKGTQYLNQGVYIYTAHGGVTESQTLVGIAEGNQKVDATAKVSLSFSVDEEKTVHVERHWREEHDPEITPPPGHPPVTTNYIEEPPVPQVFRLNHQDPEVEIIPEEPVPLAAPAITGDNSGLWVAVILVSVLCMVAINIFDKKRQHETF